MYSKPLAYHLTWGTYGTRLHGDPRGTVDRRQNTYLEPIIEFDQHRWTRETADLQFPCVLFDEEQMLFVESVLPAICERGSWYLHACAAGPDHIHVLLDAEAEPKAVRRWAKRWLGESLSERYPRPNGASWWAECGSTKYVFERDYFDAAMDYIQQQRATPHQ